MSEFGDEPLVMQAEVVNKLTGEVHRMSITIEGAPDPYAALSALQGLVREMEQAATAAQGVQMLQEMGMSQELIEKALGLIDECICGECDTPSNELASVAAPTDEEFDSFLRELNGP